MWRHVRRWLALAYGGVSEAALRLIGRRPPYGILTLDLSGELPEVAAEPRLLGWSRSRDDFFTLIGLLRWARDDSHVRAVLIRCSDLRVGWAKAQELRRSITRLRSAGKRVWVHLTHAGIQEYVLASAADKVFLAPAGTLDIAGLSSEVMFVAGALQKLGIQAEVIQMGKYKSAGEMFTRSDMSESHREMIESLVHDLYLQMVSAIADGRQFDQDHVRALLDRGPFVAREAQQERLIDGLLYADETEQELRSQCEQARTIDKYEYLSRRGRAIRSRLLRRGRGAIGVVHVTGTIKMGESIPGPESATACGVAAVARDLAELRDNRGIAAVVVRVSSPGGSGLASDLLWHEIVRTRRRKPVVVSCGDVAASGGYYIGVAGMPLFAEAGTLTGSIGVLAGKALLRGLYDHIGVTKELVSRGRHAGLYSDYIPLGDEERARLQAEAEFFYDDFVQKVADGRHLSRDVVATAAQGRVWTGQQAHARQLVDQIGGIEQAIDEAKILAGWAPDDLVSLERYPKPRPLWRLSFALKTPHARAADWLRALPSGGGERVWTILPFNFRFF